jgi:signal transduction histidine kinase/CheY-like chemotaxis protein
LREGAGVPAGVRTDETLDRLVAATIRATGATAAVVGLWNEARQSLIVPAGKASIAEVAIPADGGEIGRAWRERKALVVRSLVDLGAPGKALARPGVSALFAIPVATNERTWGVLLVLLRRASLFPDDDMVVLGLLAEQSAIALANADLIARLRTLADRLQETNLELERASEAKSDFLASMSHELRTPMNAILGFTDALLAGVDGPLSDAQKESLGWVQRGGRDLLALINDVLDLSKIEAGKVVLKPEQFAPAALLEGVWGQHRRIAEKKGLKFDWVDDGAPAQVTLDRQRTQQVVVNLVGNALKFTAKGEVKLVASSTSDGGLKIMVQDTGPGIAPEQQGLLFQEFRQVGVGAGDAGGTGLGLAISRRLARMMGGDIKLRSRPGRGSTFTITLPLDFTVPPAPRVKRRNHGGRLLLAVDDDRSLLPLLQKMLAGTSYNVLGAYDAANALKIAREQHPDVITLDILMPDRDGWQILDDLRRDPTTTAIPVVILSVVEPTRALNDVGVAAYLTKPLTKEAVMAALDSALLLPIVASSE